MRPILSIIIPTYNSKSYIGNILDYFERYRDYRFEIVFIDDCSSDGTYEYLLEKKHSFSFDLVIKKNEKNYGPGYSRNKGIIEASGEYITFMDSDDALSDQYFQSVLPVLEYGYDAIVYDALICSDQNTKYYTMFSNESNVGYVDRKNAFVFIKGCTWGKIYKKSLLTENDIRFLNIKRNEDMPFTKISIEKSKTVYYLKQALYLYRENSNSLMHNSKLLDVNNTFEAFNYLEKNTHWDYHDELEAVFLVEYLYSTVLIKAIDSSRKELLTYIRETEQKYPSCYSNKYFPSLEMKYRIAITLIRFKCYSLIKIMSRMRHKS